MADLTPDLQVCLSWGYILELPLSAISLCQLRPCHLEPPWPTLFHQPVGQRLSLLHHWSVPHVHTSGAFSPSEWGPDPQCLNVFLYIVKWVTVRGGGRGRSRVMQSCIVIVTVSFLSPLVHVVYSEHAQIFYTFWMLCRFCWFILVFCGFCLALWSPCRGNASRKQAYIMLTPLNPTFI